MKTKLITEVVEVNYWTCLDSTHKHKTQDVAQACIDHTLRDKHTTNTWTADKYKEVLERWRAGGITKRALGKLYNVTGNRIAEVIKKAERLEEEKTKAWYEW